MNSFSSSEISDLFSNRFRLEDKHTPQYLAECFQRLCPSLQRQNTSSLADSILQANSRGFRDEKPVTREDLNLSFFWQEWKRYVRLNVQDPFVFNDELKLAYALDAREFWNVVIGAEREVDTLLRDGFELMGYRSLPQEIVLNLRAGSGSVDSSVIRRIKDILRPRLTVVSLQDFAKACLEVFEQSNPNSTQIKELAERIARDNGIRQSSNEPLTLVPVSRLDSISTKCMEDFFKKAPLSSKEQDNIRQGFYIVTEADVILAQRQGNDSFWESVIQDSRDRERTLNAHKLCEMNTDARSFRAGDRILVASEQALQDALHKHSSEMREIYRLCQRAGVSSGDADKFMALLFLCHDFYDLPDINIDYAFIAGMQQSELRGLWDTMQKGAFTSSGVRNVNSQAATLKASVPQKNEDKKEEPSEIALLQAKIAAKIKGNSSVERDFRAGFYTLDSDDRQYLDLSQGDLSFHLEFLGNLDRIILNWRKKVGLDEKKLHGTEDKRLCVPSERAKSEIKRLCEEEIRLFYNLFPAFNNNAVEDLLFCALHRSYKQGKAASALGSELENGIGEILKQIRGKFYEPAPWRRVLDSEIFRHWPLQEYGRKLQGYEEHMQAVKKPETPWGQKAWQALGSFFRQYNEENRRVAEAEKRERKQPFGNFSHREIDDINQNRGTVKPNPMDRRTILQGLTMFTFKSEDLSGLNAHFRDDLIEAVKIFAIKQIQAGKEWIPVPVTDAERRTDEKQADNMLALSAQKKSLLNIYGQIKNRTPGEKEQILQLIDSKIQGTPKIDLGNVDALVKETTQDQDLRSILKNMLLAVNTTDITIYAKKALLHMLAKFDIYGSFSKHRLGQAVDISKGYSYLNNLRDYIPTYTNAKSTKVFSISSKESYAHLHIQYDWKYPESNK